MLAFYEPYGVDTCGLEGGPLHDPCVIAHLLRPDSFSGSAASETGTPVESGSGSCRGRCLADERSPGARAGR
jgi:purine nucleosidase